MHTRPVFSTASTNYQPVRVSTGPRVSIPVWFDGDELAPPTSQGSVRNDARGDSGTRRMSSDPTRVGLKHADKRRLPCPAVRETLRGAPCEPAGRASEWSRRPSSDRYCAPTPDASGVRRTDLHRSLPSRFETATAQGREDDSGREADHVSVRDAVRYGLGHVRSSGRHTACDPRRRRRQTE